MEQSPYIKDFITRCNDINISRLGTGEEDTINEMDAKKWVMYNVDTGDTPFKIGSHELNLQLVHMQLNKEVLTPLIVIPGYSDKSVCWTIGRMNRFIKEYADVFEQYSDIYIFNLEDSKRIYSRVIDEEMTRDEFDDKLTQNIDKVFKMIFRKHNMQTCNILARSAGGGIAIRLAMYNTEEPGKVNPKIKALYLMAPGYRKDGIMDFINTKIDIPLFLAFVEQDTRIPREEIYLMRTQLLKANYKRFDYIEIENKDPEKQGDNFNHRFWYHLITRLDMKKYHRDYYFDDIRNELRSKYLKE